MFTGLVSVIGTIAGVEHPGTGLAMRVRSSFRGLTLGESVAIDGACLTVESIGRGWFGVRVIRTSLERTLFGTYAVGQRVNLELALRVGDRLGGHLVQGHIDGVGTLLAVKQKGDARLIDIRVPKEVFSASIPLGSITVDGVSLTVNAIPASNVIQISLIPFTLQRTTLGERRVGDGVHLEADTIGKYIRHLVEGRQRNGRTGRAQ